MLKCYRNISAVFLVFCAILHFFDGIMSRSSFINLILHRLFYLQLYFCCAFCVNFIITLVTVDLNFFFLAAKFVSNHPSIKVHKKKKKSIQAIYICNVTVPQY